MITSALQSTDDLFRVALLTRTRMLSRRSSTQRSRQQLVSDIQHILSYYADGVVAHLPEPAKAAEDLQTFAKLNEGRLYKLLKTCMDVQTDLKGLIKARVRAIAVFPIITSLNEIRASSSAGWNSHRQASSELCLRSSAAHPFTSSINPQFQHSSSACRRASSRPLLHTRNHSSLRTSRSLSSPQAARSPKGVPS